MLSHAHSPPNIELAFGEGIFRPQLTVFVIYP